MELFRSYPALVRSPASRTPQHRMDTDFYARGLQNDEAWRREWCERVGLGFSLVEPLGLQNVVPLDSGKAA
jgi:hypothetical protein